MKKNIKTYFIGILALGSMLMTSCESFLDKQPISELSKDKFWKSPEDAQIWMAGMYDAMQSTLSSNYYYWGEARADNEQQAGTGTAQLKFLNNALTADMGECSWSNLYRTISIANFAIKYIPETPDVAKEQIASYIGQAYTMRALMYFYAIRVWGPVPLVTEPYEDLPGQKKFYARTSVDSVKAQILSDIDQALTYFDNTTTSIYYLNRGSALSLKTDVHMWFKEYQQAVDASDKLIALKKYDFAKTSTEWKNIFITPESSPECIFNIYWNFEEDGGGCGVCGLLGSGSNTSNYKIRQALWDTLCNRGTDARMWNTIDTVVLWYAGGKVKVTNEHYNYTNDLNKSSKFSIWDAGILNKTYNYNGGYVYSPNSECQVRIPIYRYTDIMLLRAEALNRLGRATEAMAIVNAVRTRNGYKLQITAINAPNVQSLEDAILMERQLDLWGEGKRWFDLVRTGNVPRVMDDILKSRGNPDGFGDIRRILFPINSAIFEGNPLITQNEPYTKN